MKYGFLKNHPQTVNTARVYYYRIEWNLDALIVRRCVKTTVRVNYFPLQLFNAHSSFSVIHFFLCSFLLQLFNFYAHSKFQRNFSSKCQTRNDACIFGCTQKKVKRFFFFCHRNTKIFIFFSFAPLQSSGTGSQLSFFNSSFNFFLRFMIMIPNGAFENLSQCASFTYKTLFFCNIHKLINKELMKEFRLCSRWSHK